MSLNVASIDGSLERRVLTSLIVSKSVLGRVSAQWDGKLFRSSTSNTLAALCINFYKKHGDAPNKAIDSLYDSWAQEQRDQRSVDEISRFLQELNGEYTQLTEEFSNSDHLIDLAGKHFREVRQDRLKEDIESALQAHDFERVDRLIESYRKVELGVGAGLHPINDQEEVKSIFDSNHSEVLVEYPGSLGEFFGYDLSRDSFVVFMGSAKSSKSFFLQDISWRAILNRKKVAYFEAGDLSRRQAELRFMIRAANWPYRSSNTKEPLWPCTIKIPVAMEVDDHPKTGKRRGRIVKYRENEYDRPLDFDIAWKACERVTKKEIRSKEPYLKLSVHSTSSLTIEEILSSLDGWAMDGWQPDVIVIDYSDIMARPKTAKDEREGINMTWQKLRKLSMDCHNLVVTATQADADSYSQETLGKKNFSGDRRKHDHVSAMYGINRTDDEVEEGVCRLNVIDRRDGEAVTKRCVHVAQCLALGQPALLSSF